MKTLIKALRRWWTESGVIPEDKTVPDTDKSARETEEDYRVVVVAEGGFAIAIKEPLNPTKKSEEL
ncbi:hypothetical protein [Falsiruegeria mediterranea]|uniref:Uncharacterized protein n=1 Tax=Falsiruegeria mediterranea M17 TaxID=1200281 RepID=A0A2R8C9Y9_9RHOB|nr:hypothetical protein [Falsiruegeria mediterranea]SPJ29225.1 hypothetical protein TRM7615_02738 [Falsiruegeria mediterranea M17]